MPRRQWIGFFEQQKNGNNLHRFINRLCRLRRHVWKVGILGLCAGKHKSASRRRNGKGILTVRGHIVDNRTEINSQLNAAEMNLEAGQATVVNPHMAASSKLQAGTILAGKYEIVKSLSVSTGEADLYICKYADKEYVAKVYRRQRAVKPEVITLSLIHI